MECRDVRELADSFLSEELLTETNHEMLRHLETCPDCRAELATRRTIRTSVRGAFERAPDLDPSPEFLTQLRTRLEETAHTAPVGRGLRRQGWWALAAMVLLAVALGFAFRGRGWITATGALARAAVGDHRNCALQFHLAEKPISLEEAAQRFDPAYRVLQRLPPPDVMTAGGLARVIERHSCVYDGRRFAHIVLEYRGARVSLLMTGVDGSPLTAQTGPAPTSVGRIDDMSVVSFRTARHMLFLAGDVAPAGLMQLAETVAGPLYTQLAGA